MNYDHNYLSVVTTCVLVALGIIGFLTRGWFKYVNDNLVSIWTELKEERTAREERWNQLHTQCNLHGERISKIEGRLDGKDKFIDALGITKPVSKENK